MNNCTNLVNRLTISTVPRLARLRNQTLYAKYTKYGLTDIQVGILIMLTTHDGCIQRDICKSMYISPSAMVQLLNNLEKKEYIMRKRSTKNRSSVHVYITPKGKTTIAEIQKMVIETEHEYLSELTADEKTQLQGLLAKAFLSWLHHVEDSNL